MLGASPRLLRLRKEKQPTRRMAEPPSSFFEPDSLDTDYEDHKLPAEVLYMLKGVRSVKGASYFEILCYLSVLSDDSSQ